MEKAWKRPKRADKGLGLAGDQQERKQAISNVSPPRMRQGTEYSAEEEFAISLHRLFQVAGKISSLHLLVHLDFTSVC